MFAPFGTVYSLELFERLLQIPGLLGIKHSSLDRAQEWQRLDLRDRLRPDFKVYTGNDLAIDMVVYGSDYLLGLSSFAPEAFALRDRL
jgi:dihydrodipicolinate synthase/N-acetylneuraminate lyase